MSPVAAVPTDRKSPAKPDGPLMPGVAWTTNSKGVWGLTATDEDTLKRLRRDELSASTSFNLDSKNCAGSMVAGRLLPRIDDIFEANQLGTAAHAVLECLMGLLGPKRTKAEADRIMKRLRTDREFALTLIDKNLTDQLAALDDENLERWYKEVQRRVYGLWDIEDPTKIDVYATEMSYGKKHNREVKIGKVPFVGFIDRVDKILNLSTGEIEGYKVIDYKAGKYKDGKGNFGDDYGDQVRIYYVAVRESEGIEPSSGSLHFITYGKGRDIDVSPEAVNKTVKRFEAAYDRMNDLADENFYPTKVGPLCGWCDLVNSCPAAVAAGKTDLTNTDKDANGKRSVVEGKPKKAPSVAALGITTASEPVKFTKTVPRGTHAAAAAQDAGSAAHIPDEQPAQAKKTITKPTVTTPTVTNQESKNMTDTATAAPKVLEGVNSREAMAGESLNGNSYTATAVWGLASLAVEQLASNDQAVNGKNVVALANTYAHIVQEVQSGLSGSVSYQDGLNTRVRGALRTSVETFPAPWGQDAAAWDAYVTSIKNRTRAISNVAVKIAEAGANLPASPWTDLAIAAA